MPVSADDVPRLPPPGVSQSPSDTSDQQRFDEMLVHLTPLGCTVPYSVLYDSHGDIWVAGKGGIFKVCGKKRTLLWSQKNPFPKKQSAFAQIFEYKDQIVATTAEDADRTTAVNFFSKTGELQSTQILDGLLQSLDIRPDGTVFYTLQQKCTPGRSAIVRSTISNLPMDSEELCADAEMAFQALCAYSDDLLVVACASMPVHPFSTQCLKWVDAHSGAVLKQVSAAGRSGSDIFFPRKIVRDADAVVLLDKAGRFLKFDADGKFVGTVAEIDAFLGNGFTVRDGEATMALSGVVQDDKKRTVCDDWLEVIRLDGSSWKRQRESAKSQPA